jgi:hypothetical protein
MWELCFLPWLLLPRHNQCPVLVECGEDTERAADNQRQNKSHGTELQ